jgi:hypothetical protein
MKLSFIPHTVWQWVKDYFCCSVRGAENNSFVRSFHFLKAPPPQKKLCQQTSWQISLIVTVNVITAANASIRKLYNYSYTHKTLLLRSLCAQSMARSYYTYFCSVFSKGSSLCVGWPQNIVQQIMTVAHDKELVVSPTLGQKILYNLTTGRITCVVGIMKRSFVCFQYETRLYFKRQQLMVFPFTITFLFKVYSR